MRLFKKGIDWKAEYHGLAMAHRDVLAAGRGYVDESRRAVADAEKRYQCLADAHRYCMSVCGPRMQALEEQNERLRKALARRLDERKELLLQLEYFADRDKDVREFIGRFIEGWPA